MKVRFKEFVSEASLEDLPTILFLKKKFSISRQDAEKIYDWYRGTEFLDDEMFDAMFNYFTSPGAKPEKMPEAVAMGEEDDPEGWMLRQLSTELRKEHAARYVALLMKKEYE